MPWPAAPRRAAPSRPFSGPRGGRCSSSCSPPASVCRGRSNWSRPPFQSSCCPERTDASQARIHIQHEREGEAEGGRVCLEEFQRLKSSKDQRGGRYYRTHYKVRKEQSLWHV